MIRILIAEDIFRLTEALKAKLAQNDSFEVVDAFANGKLLIKYLQHHSNIDVILMDINMPEMDGIEATQVVQQKWPHIKVIMSTVFDDDTHLFNAIMAGAKGYLLKDEIAEKIHQSIFEVLEGGAPMSPSIALKALMLIKVAPAEVPEDNFNLTPREKQILEQLSTGLSYDEISQNLSISGGTVRKHIENVYKKLQVHSKVEAVQKANKFRLFG